VTEYFEIFLLAMLMSGMRRTSSGCRFSSMINGVTSSRRAQHSLHPPDTPQLGNQYNARLFRLGGLTMLPERPRYTPFMIPLALGAAGGAAVHVLPLLGGDKAPDFKLGGVDGTSVVKLADSITGAHAPRLLGHWCPHCQRELPILQKRPTISAPRGMHCLGVSIDSSLSGPRASSRSTR